DPTLDVSQYAHTAWKIRDGFVKGEILSIAQTARRLSLAGYRVRLASLRWGQNCPLAAAGESASCRRCNQKPARHPRWNSMDWCRQKLGKLEGWQAHAISRTCGTVDLQASRGS